MQPMRRQVREMATTTEPQYLGTFTIWGEEGIAVYTSYDIIYPVTTCCEATAKGTEWGICCRACYEEVDGLFGMAWNAEEWAKDIAEGRIREQAKA